MNRQQPLFPDQPINGSRSSTGAARPRFSDLFDRAKIQALQDALAETARVASVIVDPEGRPITKLSNVCRFCALATRDNPPAMVKCMRPPHTAGEAGGADGPLLYRCPNGLQTASIVIRIGGHRLAHWVVGQVSDESPDEDRMAAYARKLGIDDEQCCAALAEIPVLPRDRFKKVCQTIYAAARQLSALAARNLDQTRYIAQLEQARAELRLQQTYFKQLFEGSPQAIVRLDTADRIIDANGGFEKLFQYRAEEIRGRRLSDFIIPPKLQDEASALSRAALNGEVVERESVRRRQDGSLVDVSIMAYPVEVEGKRVGINAIYNDITARKQAEDRLRYVSLHDSLTKLYNRTYFEEEMRRLECGRHFPVSIIVCDVDGLKLVNDSLGHRVGDILLVAAADVIGSVFRKEDVVARIGGDEFAVLLPKCPYPVAQAACDKIRANIERYNEKHKDLPLSISIGCACDDGTKGMSALFREADNEMYREKLQHGRSTRSAIVGALIKSYEESGSTSAGRIEYLRQVVSELGRTIGLSEAHIADLHLLVRFHNIGKVGIPKHLLLKPGRLTPEEWREIQRHSEIGHRIALSSPELAPIADGILKHREWWNGTGYPLGLEGDDICLVCRILAIADAYDAMTHNRPYRKALSHEEAVAELRRYAGIQFDPELVPKFIEILEKRRKEG